MFAGTACIVVRHACIEHCPVQVGIDGGKEVVGTAVEGIVDSGGLHLRHERGNGACLPLCRVGLVGAAQKLGHAPAVGKFCYIHSAAHRAGTAPYVRVQGCETEGPVTAHAQAHDGAVVAVGEGGETAVGVCYEVAGHEAFHLHRVRIPIPAVTAVGHDENHLETVGHLAEVLDAGYIVGMVARVAVEDIHRRETFVANTVGNYGCHILVAVEIYSLKRILVSLKSRRA